MAQNKKIYGNRIPKDYFIATGAGETDLGSGNDPWETGSYDLALLEAGIENFNIVKYTSVMPKEAVKRTYEDIKPFLHHGAVLETIMAQMNGNQGDQICAGVVTCKIRIQKTQEEIGGFACEYVGHGSEEKAKEILHKTIKGVVNRRYKPDEVEIYDLDFITKHLNVTKKHGTVLASINFVNHIYPEL